MEQVHSGICEIGLFGFPLNTDVAIFIFNWNIDIKNSVSIQGTIHCHAWLV